MDGIKRGLRRLFNVFTVITVGGWLVYVWNKVLTGSRYVGGDIMYRDLTIDETVMRLFESIGFTLGVFVGLGILNYILLGKLTVWWKKEDTNKVDTL